MKIIELFNAKYEVVIQRDEKNNAMVVLHDTEIGEPSVVSTASPKLKTNEVAIKDLDLVSISDKLIETGLLSCADRFIIEGFQGYRVLTIN